MYHMHRHLHIEAQAFDYMDKKTKKKFFFIIVRELNVIALCKIGWGEERSDFRNNFEKKKSMIDDDLATCFIVLECYLSRL